MIGGDWFDEVVGWANIAGAVLALVVPLALLSRRFESADSRAARIAAEKKDLADAVLKREGDALARLISIDKVTEVRKIDLKFDRSAIQYRTAGGASTGTTLQMKNYFDGLHPRRLIILGEPGSGKTVAALELITQILRDPARDERAPVPLRVPLPSSAGEGSIQQWLIDLLTSPDYKMERDSAALLVSSGQIMPVLDGLDELDSDQTLQPRANSVVALINDYLFAGEAAPVVVTSRTSAYASLADGVHEATEVVMSIVEPPTAIAYLQNQYKTIAEEIEWLEVVRGLGGTFGQNVVNIIGATLNTPWLIGATLAVCRSSKSPAISPNEIFYQSTPIGPTPPQPHPPQDARLNVLRSFISTRKRDGKLEYDDSALSSWLRFVATHLRAQVASGQPSQLRLDTWWLIRNRQIRLIQAIFALAISTIGIWGVYQALGGAAVLDTGTIQQIVEATPMVDLSFLVALGSVAITCVGGLLAGIYLAVEASIRPHVVKFRTLGSLSGVRIVALGTLAGFIIGGAIGAGVGLTNGLSVGVARGLVIGGIGGLPEGLILGVCTSISSSRTDREGAASIIIDDFWYGLTYALLLGSVATISGIVSIGPRFGLLSGLVLLLWFGLIAGPRVAVRYAIAVIWLRIQQPHLPVRFGTMLDWCVEAGILRRVGLTYQFRQQEIQDALADGRI